jgi:type IV pilus assembly protein PilN
LPENLKEKSSAEPNPSVFSSVLGLATRKLDVFGYYEYVTGTNNINLLPNRDGIRNQEKMKFLSRWGVLIFFAISIVFGLFNFFSAKSEIQNLALKVTEHERLTSVKNQKIKEYKEIRDKKQEVLSNLETSKNIKSNQKFMYLALLGINSAVPPGVSLASINYIGDGSIIITGLSTSDQNILQFIENLSKSNNIDKASLLTMSAKKVDERSFKSFSIRCILIEQKVVIKQE